MMFQKSFLSITECKELQPDSANGKMVGLFIPGSTLMMSCNLSFGALSKTYRDFRAFKTDCKRNCSLLRMANFSSEIKGDAAKTASDFKMTSTSFKLFLNNVLPLETISQMASARPIFGAISTEPLMMCKLA